MNQLEQLKKLTTVVADTGDIASIAKYKPQDATTNPTLILKSVVSGQNSDLIRDAIEWSKSQSNDPEQQVHFAVKKLLVNFGVKILSIIPGRVSTEIDAKLSFDIPGSIHQAQEIINLYQQAGIGRERVLIKIASTWEGIQAAEILEQQGTHCNMTLMFDIVQAAACAEAGVTLISPFVGRIYDWYKKNQGQEIAVETDPGVLSIKNIYHYLHHFDYPTQVMGASFRHINQIRALAGCDFLTISPPFLAELENSTEKLAAQLLPEISKQKPIEKLDIEEKNFRWLMNENPMASEKLAEGISLFSNDLRQLEIQLATILQFPPLTKGD